jgi:uncharacterized protein (DUF849 family)
MAKKVIVTAAITGGIHTPQHVALSPLSVDQIIEDALKANEAGAAAVHIHAREPGTGKPSRTTAHAEDRSGIKKRCKSSSA